MAEFRAVKNPHRHSHEPKTWVKWDLRDGKDRFCGTIIQCPAPDPRVEVEIWSRYTGMRLCNERFNGLELTDALAFARKQIEADVVPTREFLAEKIRNLEAQQRDQEQWDNEYFSSGRRDASVRLIQGLTDLLGRIDLGEREDIDLDR